MHLNDTILIYQKPELYFFPHYKDIVYAPYDKKEKTPLYYLYRLLNLVHLPFSSFFWGHWKKKIPYVSRVIIFDYGYQNCMEKYIKKLNPNCEVYLFCWNKIDKYHNNNSKFTIKSNIFSTDKGDCEKFKLRYNHIFYPIEFRKDWDSAVSKNVYFIGADKGRAEKLLSFHQLFKSCGLNSNIHMFSSSKDPVYLDRYHEILIGAPINYKEYIDEVLQNGILLDITQKGQRAITMRVLESVVYSKKLITSNIEVKSFPFYNKNNILLIDIENMPSAKTIQDFVSMPFIPYTNEQLYEISFEHWIKGF